MGEATDELLNGIQRSLDEIKAILKLVNQEKLQQVREALLKEGSVKKQVYDLCDEPKTTEEIAAGLQKDTNYVRAYVSPLRRDGLVRTLERGGRQVHEQVL